MLYGFSGERARRYFPLCGDDADSREIAPRAGGSVRVRADDAVYRLSRFANTNDPHDPGVLRVTSDDGTFHGAHPLDVLLSGVDESIFRNVYALGLSELEQLAALNDTAVAEQLYHLSTGLDRVSLSEVLGELDLARRHLLAPGTSQLPVTDLMAQCAQRGAEVQNHIAKTEHSIRLRMRSDALNEEIAKWDRRRDHLGRRLRVIELAQSVRPQWVERQQLDQQLSKVDQPASFSSHLLPRLRLWREKLARCDQRLEQLQRRRGQLRKRIAQLPLSDALCRNLARTSALADQKDWLRSLCEQIERLEHQVEQIEGELQAEKEKIGIAGDQPILLARPLKRHTWSALRGAARQLRRDRSRLAKAKQERDSWQSQAMRCHQQIAEGLRDQAGIVSPGVDCNLARAAEETGRMAGRLRRRIQLEEIIGQSKQHFGELEQREAGLIERQVLPMPILAAVSCLFVLGFVLLVTGLVGRWFSLGDPLRLLMVLTGAVAGGAAVAMKIVLKRSVADQLLACQRQHELIKKQVQAARDELVRLDEQIPAGEGPLADRLRAEEARLAEWEKLLPIDADRRAALAKAAAAEQSAAAATASLSASRQRWRRALQSEGLPDTLSPRKVRLLVDHAGSLTVIQAHLEELREELGHRRGELSQVQSRIVRLMSETGLKPESPGALEQLEQLVRAANEQHELVKKRRTYRRQAHQLRRQHKRIDRARGKLRRRHAELIAAAGVTNEEELEQLEQQQETISRLVRERDALTGQIAARIDQGIGEDQIARELDRKDESQLDERRRRLERDIGRIGQKLKRLHRRQGQFAHELKSTMADRHLAELHFDLAALRHELGQRLDRWKVLSALRQFLQSVYQQYERERQPETLRKASIFLRRFTEGRYPRVWTPLGEDVLRVDTSPGQSLPVERLSRGTREQVYLSLRLALVVTYARRGTRMPMVLDDVLVNFDTARARAAARVLVDFAKSGYQLLVFTCHEHIRSIFQELGAEARELPHHAELISAPSSHAALSKQPGGRRAVAKAGRSRQSARANPQRPDGQASRTRENESADRLPAPRPATRPTRRQRVKNSAPVTDDQEDVNSIPNDAEADQPAVTKKHHKPRATRDSKSRSELELAGEHPNGDDAELQRPETDGDLSQSLDDDEIEVQAEWEHDDWDQQQDQDADAA